MECSICRVLDETHNKCQTPYDQVILDNKVVDKIYQSGSTYGQMPHLTGLCILLMISNDWVTIMGINKLEKELDYEKN
jgi:hypothetical protein